MVKKIFKPLNIIIVILIIVFSVMGILACVNGNSKQMGNDNYMTSENFAKGAKVSGDVVNKAKLVNGKHSDYATLTSIKNAEVTIDLGIEREINSVILKENGFNCLSFEISVSVDGKNFKTVHKGDKIEYQRLCTFPTAICRYIRISVFESKSTVKIKEIEVFNEKRDSSADFRVSGYYSDGWDSIYLNEELSIEEKDNEVDKLIKSYNIDNLTNLFMYCGMKYEANGNVFLDKENNELRKNALKKLVDRIKYNSKRDITISLTFGASTGDQNFLSAISINKQVFMDNLTDFCREIGFDGVDIDYEFPFTKNDYALYDAFLIRFKKHMIENLSPNAILSCAFGTRDIKYSKEAREAIDIVNCMTYDIFDQDGQHSSFWGGCIQGGIYLESVGFTKEQINLGIPFYGTQVEGLMEQYIYKNIPNLDYYKNTYTLTDYTGRPTEVYFNSPSMVRDKTAYALLAGYGGMMTWHSSCDVDVNNEFSLWRAVNDAVKMYGGVR